jgi:Tfp pilus assembly protein PilN
MEGSHHILHLKRHISVVKDPAPVRAIYAEKGKLLIPEPHIMRKSDDASATIAAHSTLAAVTIEIDHLKIKTIALLQVDQSIAAYTETTVTEMAYETGIFFGEAEAAVVYDDKIIAGALVFIKWKLHNRNAKEIFLEQNSQDLNE